MEQDIRWRQRYANYQKALGQLSKFIEKGNLNELEEQGLIQAFEYTYELAWNVMKDFFQYHGDDEINGSRDAIRLAFKRNLIENGAQWMDMIASRIKSSHTYNEETAKEVANKITDVYFHLFIQFSAKMDEIIFAEK
jgi:nucleotidyltransferase substrate binding protein (TIGR01987 family)